MTGPSDIDPGSGLCLDGVIAGADISANRAFVVTSDLKAYPADTSNAAHQHILRGIATASVLTGAEMHGVLFGWLTSGSWTAAHPVYVNGTAGELSQTPPSTGWRRRVAVAHTTSLLFVDPYPTDLTAELVGVVWGTPGPESGDAIEISATIQDAEGKALASSVVDVDILVTDGAADNEPSSTATLSAASVPVGTILSGSGTARVCIRSAAGAFAIRVNETAAANRYLWLTGGGNARLVARSTSGVIELVFS